MLNWLVIYGLVVGAAIRFVQHNRMVVPASTARQGRWGFFLTLRLAIIAAALIWPGSDEVYRHAMAASWTASPTLVVLATAVATLLGLLQGITFETGVRPHLYTPGASGHMFRVDMRLTTYWYLAFWAWTLSNPMLPFGKCFIRVFLLGADPSIVVPVT